MLIVIAIVDGFIIVAVYFSILKYPLIDINPQPIVSTFNFDQGQIYRQPTSIQQPVDSKISPTQHHVQLYYPQNMLMPFYS